MHVNKLLKYNISAYSEIPTECHRGLEEGNNFSGAKNWEGGKEIREGFKEEIIFEISLEGDAGRNARIFNIRNLIYVIYHIKELKEESHVVISSDADMG